MNSISTRIVTCPNPIATTPTPTTSTPQQVSIGIQLAANPAILFLDEPTSGLDSRGAMVVMRVIKRVASLGRTVITTVHQPSVELFRHFDNLLLMRKGGRVVCECRYIFMFTNFVLPATTFPFVLHAGLREASTAQQNLNTTLDRHGRDRRAL